MTIPWRQCLFVVTCSVTPFVLFGIIFGWVYAVACALALLTSILLYGWYPTTKLRQFPGPKPHWFWGHLPEMAAKGYHITDVEYSRTFGGICRILEGRNPWLLVSDPDLIQEVFFKRFNQFHDRPSVFQVRAHKHLLWAKGAYWEWTRRALNPAFNSTRLRQFSSGVQMAVQELVDRLASVPQGTDIDVHRWLCNMTMSANLRTSFGQAMDQTAADAPVSSKDSQDAISATLRLIRVSDPSHVGQLIYLVAPFLLPLLLRLGMMQFLVDMRDALSTLDRCTLALVKARRKDPSWESYNDFITLMLQARDPTTNQALDDEEITDQGNLFLIAGYETTGNCLAYTCFLISTHSAVEEAVLREIDQVLNGRSVQYDDLPKFKYLEAVINESLRLYPPAPRCTRVCTQDTVLGGYHISKGTHILIPVYAVHRDPKYWPEPEEFKPERFLDTHTRHPCAHIPFGAGRHMCIGFKFALEELKLTLVSIFQRFTFRITSQTRVPLRLTPRVTMAPTDGIHVTVHPRGQEVKQQ